jgi:aminoglycoside phosphotransferase (APT) family kinase protein
LISRTKYPIDASAVLRLLDNAGLSGVTHAVPLGDGEFNAVYLATAQERRYVVKIAPPEGAPIMTYEKNMIQSEVFWYGVMREKTNIRIPDVFYADFSLTLLPAPYFIMEYLPGEPLNKAQLTQQERAAADGALAQMAAQLHAVKNARFGYIQCGLYENWYAAIRAFTDQTLADCARKNRRSPRGERLKRLLERHRAVLEEAPCRMVNFDIWPANSIISHEGGGIRLAWIDPERCFWGDPMLDFVCFAFHKPLYSIPRILAAYNAAAREPVTQTEAESIRFAAGQGYLALIMETEKYYRYSPFRFGWWRNVIACRLLYRAAFAALDQ